MKPRTRPQAPAQGPGLRRRHLPAGLACLAATAAQAGLQAPAQATAKAPPPGPQDQLLMGLSMNNLQSLDPAGATGLDALAVGCNLYDSLLELDPRDSTRLVPGLASAWTVEAGGSLLRLQLRAGALFDSGQPVTAEDAAWSLQRVLRLNLALATVWKSYGLSADNVTDMVQADGPQRLSLRLPRATDPQLVLYTLATSMSGLVVDRHTVLAHERAGDLGRAWLATHAAGSGAFTLAEWRPKELMLLARAPRHWRGPARLARVVLRHMTESQTLRLMLSRGDLDIATGLSAPDLRALGQRAELAVESVQRGTLYYVALNARQPQFADERVRRAILRHLIDSAGLAQGVLPGYARLHQRPVPPGLPASLPAPGYRLDVDQARRLLAEAGHAQGFDTTIRVVAEAPFLALATNLQASLAQAGIRASILPGTGNQVYGAMRERTFDIVVGRGGGGGEPHPHSSLRALVYNPDNRDSARLTNFQGWRTGHADATLNQLIEQALLTRDPQAQAQLYQQAQQRFDAAVGAIQPVGQMLDTQVLRRVVQGYLGHPAGTTRLHGVYKVAA